MSGFTVDTSLEAEPVPNSARDRTARPVTPVAEAQRARQSGPPVSASVRQHTWMRMAEA
jgi:hypothetical protein